MGEKHLNPASASPPRPNRWVWGIVAGVFLLFIIVRLASCHRSGDGLGLGDKVAIVALEGPIYTSETVVNQLDELSERGDVKAIVLRVDSPGGSVAASQEIYEKVARVNSQKPVVVSMGAVAASGGFYAALGSSRIVANPGSVTGSIGVILEYPVAVDLLAKVGLQLETVTSGPLKDAGSPARSVSDQDRELFQSLVDDMHDQFVTAVETHRHLNRDIVLSLADGRVFTGRQALEQGLIDTLGTLEDAVAIAADLGHISGKPESIRIRKRPPNWMEWFFGSLEQVARRRSVQGPAYRWRWE